MKTAHSSKAVAHRALLVFALSALLPAMPAAIAQPASQMAPQPAISLLAASQRHADGLAMEHRKDYFGAFAAFTEAAQNGYPPAQLKLGDLYGHGTPAVVRDYEESLRWYDKARENGEIIPPIQPRTLGLEIKP